MGTLSRKLMEWLRPRDPEPVKPERNMREEIMRRSAAVYGGGPNRGDVGSQEPRDLETRFWSRLRKLRQ